MTRTADAAPSRLAALVEATPPDRDRYVDLLRAVSIVVVAIGHWLLAVVRVGPDGALTGTNALAEVPVLQRLTWVFQVMPLFFLVGGYAAARSWASARRTGTGYAAWLTSRLRRLAAPTALFVGVWLVAAIVLRSLGVSHDAVRVGAGLVAVPLWFVAVYALLVALAPPMTALHRRGGWAVPAALTVAVIAVDVAHAAGVPLVGWLNFALVWLVPQQLGFLWADGRLGRQRAAVALAAGGLGLLLLLTATGLYPVSMVGVPGAARSNNAPPTVALVALTLWQLGGALLLAPVARRWLQRRRVWAAVIAVNARAMTLFLWHLSALVVVAVVAVPRGWFGDAAPGTAAWWTSRPGWLLALAVALVPFVVVLGRFERPAARTARAVGTRVALAATAGVTVGCALLATAGLDLLAAPFGIPTIGALVLLASAGVLLAPSTASAAHR